MGTLAARSWQVSVVVVYCVEVEDEIEVKMDTIVINSKGRKAWLAE